MKDTIKVFMFLAVGLFSAVIVYPFLHETGHTVAAIAVGARVVGLSFFPTPFVVCEVFSVNNYSIAVIALSGMLFPFAVSQILRPKHFWLWYLNLIIKLISLLSFIISFSSTILYIYGIPLENDDIIRALKAHNNGEFLLICFNLIMIFVITLLIVKEKPFKRIKNYIFEEISA